MSTTKFSANQIDIIELFNDPAAQGNTISLVTYESLNANDDVGSAIGQVANGVHTHTGL